MNKLKLKIQNREPWVIALVLFVCSFITGIVVARVGAKYLLDGFDHLNLVYFKRISDMKIAYGDLFQYILLSNYKQFVIFWLLSITILALPYMGLIIVKQGFQFGFLLSALMMQYHLKGFLLMIVYLFPHGLIYVPILLHCLKIGYEISYNIRSSNTNSLHNIYMLRNYRKLIILLIIGIFVGAIIETFISSFLLRRVLTLF